jgi:hypothetical protein
MGKVLIAQAVGGYAVVAPPPPADPPPVTPPSTDPYPTAATPWLPFDMPTAAALDAVADTGPIAAVHAMQNWRRTVQDKNLDTDKTAYEWRYWLPPGAVEGATATSPGTNHAAYGGFMRNRPRGRAPIGAGYSLADKRWEIQQMQAAGIGHLTIDILGSDTWSHCLEWVQAAYLEGWRNRVILMPDCGASIVRNGAVNLAGFLKQVYTGPYAAACRKHSDGRWLVMPYAPETALSSTKTSFTDQQLIDYWKTWSSTMVANGTPAALWCCFTRAWRDATEHTSTCFTDPQLAGVVVGLGFWGTRNPVAASANNIDAAGAPSYARTTFQLPFVYTVGVEDNRPDQSRFEEAGGWENLIAWATTTINANPAAVQIATWNDWREGAAVAPSAMHGWATLDVLSYYLVRIRLGAWPRVVRDGLYLAHRTMNTPTVSPQPTYTADTTVYTKRMVKAGSTPERNMIDLLVFAKEPGQVSITIGGVAKTCTIPVQQGIAAAVTGTSVTVPAGVTRVQAPMSNGTVAATLKRAGVTVPGGSVTSPAPINLNSALVQDMMYWRTSSLR